MTDEFSSMNRKQLDELLRAKAGNNVEAQVAYIRSVILSDDDIREILRLLKASSILEGFQKVLEAHAPKGSEVLLVNTGTGPFLYLAVDEEPERKVLGLRVNGGRVMADVCGEDTGHVHVGETPIINPSDLDPLLEQVLSWLPPVANVQGVERLETK